VDAVNGDLAADESEPEFDVVRDQHNANVARARGRL
jgi:hypothetical protein